LTANAIKIFLAKDFSEATGRKSYMYSVTGLTREVFEEYKELVKEKFPVVIEDQDNGTEVRLHDNL